MNREEGGGRAPGPGEKPAEGGPAGDGGGQAGGGRPRRMGGWGGVGESVFYLP